MSRANSLTVLDRHGLGAAELQPPRLEEIARRAAERLAEMLHDPQPMVVVSALDPVQCRMAEADPAQSRQAEHEPCGR